MKYLILICAVGMAFGQSGPITFCALGDDYAAIWMMRHHIQHDRFYVRHPSMDHGCLDKMVGYEAVTIAEAMALPASLFLAIKEPLDVSAIQESVGYCDGIKLGKDVKWVCDKKWTCADKERILEHSESGKYWCRKVQP